MFKNLKLIIWILILGISFAVNAQEVKLVRIEIQNALSENDFEKKGIRLFFLVKSDETIQDLDRTNSKVLSFKDNNGNDLLLRHEQEINIYKKLVKESIIRKVHRNESIINYNESETIPAGLGLVFDSWALPEKNITELHLIADISITTLATKETQSTVVTNIDFNSAAAINWLGKQIPIKKSEYWGFGKEKYKYQLQNQDLEVSVQKIEQVDNKNNVINEIKLQAYSNHTEFSLKEIDKPIHLKITYKRLENKSFHLDQKFGLGL